MSGRVNIHTNNSGSQQVSLNDTSTSSVSINPRSTDQLNVNVQSVEPLKLSLHEANTSRITIMAPVPVIAGDYNTLTGLPTINGVTVKGNLTYLDLFLAKENINTKAYWNSQTSYIPEFGEIVIYQDRNVIDNVLYPGIKIGDGSAYLIDLPFVGDELYNQIFGLLTNHINNTEIHVTSEEKTFWNNKLNCDVENGTLVFSRQ